MRVLFIQFNYHDFAELPLSIRIVYVISEILSRYNISNPPPKPSIIFVATTLTRRYAHNSRLLAFAVVSHHTQREPPNRVLIAAL